MKTNRRFSDFFSKGWVYAIVSGACLLVLALILARGVAGWLTDQWMTAIVRNVSGRPTNDANSPGASKRNEQIKENAIEVIERIRKETGRLPRDATEIESLTDKKLPVLYDNGAEVEIHYHKLNGDRFLLVYTLYATDDWVYDSSKPHQGWVQRYY